MIPYNMTEAESLLAELIWAREPVRSGELVKLASQRLGWKKSTTYTVLRRLCRNEIFQNQAAVVTAKISREEYTGRTKDPHLPENHSVSLPAPAPAPLKQRTPGEGDIEEQAVLIEEYKE